MHVSVQGSGWNVIVMTAMISAHDRVSAFKSWPKLRWKLEMEYGRLVVTVIKTLESGPKILVVFETAALALVGPIFYRPVQCYKHNQQRRGASRAQEPGGRGSRTARDTNERSI